MLCSPTIYYFIIYPEDHPIKVDRHFLLLNGYKVFHFSGNITNLISELGLYFQCFGIRDTVLQCIAFFIHVTVHIFAFRINILKLVSGCWD